MLVGLMNNSITKQNKKWPSKKSVKVSFVTPGMEKKWKKGRRFSVYAPAQEGGAAPPLKPERSAHVQT